MINFLKYFQTFVQLEEIHTDNNVFRLHYKLTVILLLAFSFLLTSKSYFGNPIDCDVEERKKLIDTFCWISGTFVVKRTLADRHLPGLGQVPDDSSAVSRQTYYQWVCLAFCVQALLFSLPRYLWKSWEGGKLSFLVKDLSGPGTTPNWSSAATNHLVKYLLHGKLAHNVYARRFCVCEILNFINVIAQIYFMDWFISGRFSLYGIAYAAHKAYKLANPMNEVFPKVTKCTYFKTGPSGSEERRDALCILPLNVLNEKFFLILWYWLFILLVVSFLALVYRALFLFVPRFRVYLLRAQTWNFDRKKCRAIVEKLSYGNFFLLYKIGKNVNPLLHEELVAAIYSHSASKGTSCKGDFDGAWI